MKTRTAKTINKNGKPGILILSHGPLAAGLFDSLEMIVGEQENIAAFSYEIQDELNDFTDRFMEAYKKLPEETIVMVDIYGGSPCNQFILRSLQDHENILALTGVSLPMTLEACSVRGKLHGQELLADIQKHASEGIVNVTEKINERRNAK